MMSSVNQKLPSMYQKTNLINFVNKIIANNRKDISYYYLKFYVKYRTKNKLPLYIKEDLVVSDKIR